MKKIKCLILVGLFLSLLVPLFSSPVDQGIALYNQGKAQEAATYLENLLKKEPANAEALAYLALSLNVVAHKIDFQTQQGADKLKKLSQKAVDYAQKSLKIKKNAPAYSALAQSYSHMVEAGEMPQKLVDYIRENSLEALKLNDKDAPAMICLAYIYLRAPKEYGGEPEKARQLLEKVKKLDGENSYYFLGMAEYYSLQGNKTQAETTARQVLKMPENGNQLRAKLFLAKLTDDK